MGLSLHHLRMPSALLALLVGVAVNQSVAAAPTSIVLGLSPRADYSTICTLQPAPSVTYDWATWPGGTPPMDLPRMYADAMAYRTGTGGVPSDPVLSRRMFEYLAIADWEKRGDATYQLARTYLDASSSTYDPAAAVELLKAAMQLGSGSAATYLGKLFLNGREVQKDGVSAKRFLMIGAATGNIDASLSLSRLFLQRPDLQDTPAAWQDYLKLGLLKITTEVARGNCSALSYLGGIYADDDLGLYDPLTAVAWYEASFRTGDLDAVLPLAHFYRTGEGVQPDAAKAISLLTLAANAGEVAAMADLGEMLLETRDPLRATEGITWLKRAADNLDARGFELLSAVAEGAYGQEPDLVAAFEYLNRAAAFPNVDATIVLRLADAYLAGRGTTADPRRAYDLYRRAASLGNPDAYIAMFNLSGTAGINDGSNPILLLRTAANLGDGDAMNKLSDAYACGTGVDRNLETSRLWLERAASVGSASAMRKLAITAQSAGDQGEYIRMLRRAAQGRDADAMVLLGWTYMHGLTSSTDVEKGQHWIDAALDDGSTKVRASIALARLVAVGDVETPPNQEAAKQYLLTAEAAGNSSAMYELGKLFSDGASNEADIAEGRKYFLKAAQLGHVAAMLRLADMRVDTQQGGGRDWSAWLDQAVGTGNIRAIVMRSEQATNPTERHGLFDAALSRNICDGKDLVTLATALEGDPAYEAHIPDLLQRAVSIGTDDGGALYNLGRMMRAGLAGEEWIDKGVDYLKAAANAGKVEAAREVGRYYLNPPTGTPELDEASRWLLKAAQAGDDDAIEDLASLVADGTMPAEAVRAILDQLDVNVATASANSLVALAKFYSELSSSDPRYAVRANEILQDAAGQGDGGAMLQLADHYAQGVGVEKSPIESTQWLRRAAEAGYPQAFARYAIALQLGVGVDPNPEEARVWLERAAATSSDKGE